MDGVLTEPALDRLTWRPATAADVPAWARLLAAVEAADRTGENYGKADLAEELADPSLDLARDTLVAAAPDGELVAFGGLRGSATVRDVDRIWLGGAVHPAARGRGLGRRLLTWQERRAAELHHGLHPGAVLQRHGARPHRRAPPGPACSGPAAGRPVRRAVRRGDPARASGGVRRPLGVHAAGPAAVATLVHRVPELPPRRQPAGARRRRGRGLPAVLLLGRRRRGDRRAGG